MFFSDAAQALGIKTAPPLDGGARGPLHVVPHYRTPSTLAPTLAKLKAGTDEFIGEKFHDILAAVLNDWSAELRSTGSTSIIEKSLALNFTGHSLLPAQLKSRRKGPGVEVFDSVFEGRMIAHPAFLSALRETLRSFSKVMTAEFQITRLEASPKTDAPEKLSTRVRYELVAAGNGFHREQRVGEWELDWVKVQNGKFGIQNWRAVHEQMSRAASPVYVDIAAQSFAAAPSFSSQLEHGVDYWRTVLDGACGIDIYGHNGVAVGDLNNDGHDDLYVCQPAGLPNRLYRNRGDGTFEDITDNSGVGLLANTACALFADFRNTGRQDLLVVRTNGPLLFLNEGSGKFRAHPEAFRFAQDPQGTFTGAAVADYDRNGLLDVYFCLYLYYQGTGQYKYPVPYYDAENGPPNFLMRNNGDGTFTDVTAQSGLNRNNTRYSFCCAWADIDGNGWPDLYVVNDFGRKNLYRNNGDGTFTDIAEQAGAADVGAGMSVSTPDYNNDGAPDLYVADMWTAAGQRISQEPAFQREASPQARDLYRKHAMGNSLLRNTGTGTFVDESSHSGTAMGRWAWASDGWDFDHDGHTDLYVTNGMVSGPSGDDLDSFFWRQVVSKSPASYGKASAEYEQGWNAINELLRADGTWSGYERNVLYANNRDGSFSDVSGAIGIDFLEDGRAFALADFDHDGRLEVLLKNRNAPQVRLLKNAIAALPASLSFRLSGRESNRDAIGAVVTLHTSSGMQMRAMQAGSGFLSQHTKELFFGLGDHRGPFRASIRWPSGRMQEVNDIPANHRIFVVEGEAGFRAEPFIKRALPQTAPSPSPESMPTAFGTWLLAPFAAPEFALQDAAGKAHSLAASQGKIRLLVFWSREMDQRAPLLSTLDGLTQRDLEVIAIQADEAQSPPASNHQFTSLLGSADMLAVYNIVFEYLFDRHRDMPLPCSMLLDASGNIVKVYQGMLNTDILAADLARVPETDAARTKLALPFSGVPGQSSFRRNYLSYGSVFFQHGYFEEAKHSFGEALKQDPESAEACYGIGSAELKLGRPQQAHEYFDRATKLPASYPETLPNAWNNLGLLAAQNGQTDEAIRYFQEALKQSPELLIALVNLGNAYRQAKDWQHARETLARAVELKSDDPDANYSLGMVFAQSGDSDNALKYLRAALNARPDYPEALNNLGVLYLRTGREQEAIDTFKHGIEVAPSFEQSYLNLARVYAVEHRPEAARSILLQLLKEHPDNTQAKQALTELSPQ